MEGVRASSVARPRPGERVLDVATGSGDLAVALCRKAQPGGEVWITDINRRMLERGRDRLLDAGVAAPAVQCDAERLPFPSGYFDCVTVGFGLRNMTRKDAALAEMARVLKPGGRLVVLEFSKVWKPLEPAYDCIRSRCCRGSATRSPVTRTPTATSPSRSASTRTRPRSPPCCATPGFPTSKCLTLPLVWSRSIAASVFDSDAQSGGVNHA